MNFPSPYPDELFYSVIARYHLRAGNIYYSHTNIDLFGHWNRKVHIEILWNLSTIEKYTNGAIPAKSIIQNNTFFPFYSPFLSKERRKKMYQRMLSSNKNSSSKNLGIKIKTKTYFWICETCMKEDINSYGETYWHRIHQLPGVYICPKHKNELLSETNISVNRDCKEKYVCARSDMKFKRISLNLTKQDFEILLAVSKMAWFLLNKEFENTVDRDFLKNKYCAVIKNKGYAAPKGKVRHQELLSALNALLSNCILRLLQVEIDQSRKSNWFPKIFFSSEVTSFHPIYHFIVIILLGLDIKHLFDKEVYSPFGEGPWKCLNPVCPSEDKKIIPRFKLLRDRHSGLARGIFKCPICDFEYSRNENTKRCYTREYGPLWKYRFTKMVNQRVSPTKISTELNCPYQIVKRFMNQLKSNQPMRTRRQERFLHTLNEKKSKWILLRKENPGLLISELKKKDEATYQFLINHNPEWLSQGASSISIERKQSNSTLIIKWQKIDDSLSLKVDSIVENWNYDVGFLSKISVSEISRRIGVNYTYLKVHKKKLPKTMMHICNAVETPVNFRIRKINIALTKVKQENRLIDIGSICDIAKIKRNSSRTADREALNYIQKQINQLKNKY